MTELSFEALGLSKDDMLDRVADQVAENLLSGYSRAGYDGKFHEMLRNKVLERVDKAIEDVAAKNVLPSMESYVENLVLQQTNRWGEKTEKPQTFLEYMTARAEAFITEQVNSRGQPSGYSDAQCSRLEYLLGKHINAGLTEAVKTMSADMNASLVAGIQDAMTNSLAQYVRALPKKKPA